MPAGRPTDYLDSYPSEIETYIDSCGRQATELPTREGFARLIKVNVDTIVEWEKKYPQFSVALKRLDEAQKSQLMNDGLYGGKDVNSSMAIFLLKANHNMIETEKKMLVGDGGGALKIEIIEDKELVRDDE